MNQAIMNAPALAGTGQSLPDRFEAAAREYFGDRYSTGESICTQHGRDESPFLPVPPQAVVFAQSTDDVVFLVNLCRHHQVILIPYGVGSSIEGSLLAVAGGVSLDLSQMNRVLSVHAQDATATVEPGVTRMQLNRELAASGLFFPIDPGADASIGGMCATRASGTNAVRYGTMRENVLSLTVVTADGKVVRTARRARKSSAGYDLTRLFIGSEGTLGVIVEATVRLFPQPEAISAAVMSFPDARSAIAAVIQTIQVGVPIARSEFLCERTIRAINAHSKTSLREQPTLFLEFHGTAAGVREQIDTVRSIADDFGGQDFEWATRPEDRTRLWQARHHAYFACLQARPGSRAVSTDTCVPISRLADSIEGARVILDRASIPSMLFGHVGDGNFHALILVDPLDPLEMAQAEQLNAQIVRLALAMDGTCTGEHGVGLHKIGFLVEEHGEDTVDLMRRIKQALDPQGIFNPEKIFRSRPGAQ
jgi:D-lactate dehydrogenase (cytochrome)